MRIGLQEYTVRSIDEPLSETLERATRARFQGVELRPKHETEAVLDALHRTGLTVPSVGADFESLVADPERHVDTCEAFGCEDLVVLWLGEERFSSQGALSDTATELDALADEVADYGLSLHYHNHDHEFVEVDGRLAFEQLVEETDAISFELDLGWAGTGGVDPVEYLDRIGDRVSLAHVKDMDFDDGEFVTFGEGDLDIQSSVEAARDHDLEWLIFENDEPIDPIAEPAHASLVLDEYTDHV